MASMSVTAPVKSRAWPSLLFRIVGAGVLALLFGLFCQLDPTTRTAAPPSPSERAAPALVLGLAVACGMVFVSTFRRPFRVDLPAAGPAGSGRMNRWTAWDLGACGVGMALAASLGLGLDFWRDAQAFLALVALVLIGWTFWNCFEVYWDMIWKCPLLAIEAALLLGMAMGVVLPGYGLTNLFWGDGFEVAGALVVPVLSSFMIVLTLALLLLCGFFSITIMYDEALSLGLNREDQRARRVMELWRGLLPATRHDDPMREPGHFVWWCLRPILLLLALPAAMPVLSVSPTPGRMSRGGWILGLTAAGWMIRWLLIDRSLVRWVAMWTSSDRDKPYVNYPLTINAKGLFLVAGPLLITLLTAHVCDLKISARTWPGSLILDILLVLLCAWAIRALGWPRAVLREYLAGACVVIASTMVLALSASQGLGWYIAAPFSLCWLLMAAGVASSISLALVSGYIVTNEAHRRARGYRRFAQATAVVGLFGLLWWNGRAPSHSRPYASLAGYDAWYQKFATSDGRPISSRFGSPALKDSPDAAVLRRWRDGAPPAVSDQPLKVGSWRKQEDGRASRVVDERAKPKLIVVATSGGGLRAAVWAEKVLYELERAIPEFPDRARLITGSSGGMLGAACFVTGLTGWDPDCPEVVVGTESSLMDRGRADAVDKRVGLDLKHDFLTPVVHRLVFGDVEMLSPSGQSVDRGMVLEDQFLRRGHPIARLEHTFKELADLGEREGRRPSMVITPTMVEDSRRLVISNLDLGPLTMNHGAFDMLTGEETYEPGPDFPYYSTSGIQFFHVFPRLHDPDPRGEFNLAKAIRMNATFPYVTPAVAMQTLVPRRVVDAGYYDNYGIDLAVSWLEQHRRWLELNTSGVTLIQIRAFSNESQLKRLEPDEPMQGLAGFRAGIVDSIARGSQFLTTPLAGIGAARMNVNFYRNDSAVENLKRSFTFDMLERLSGIALKDQWGRKHPDAKAESHTYTDGEKAELSRTYPSAVSFFRVFTFTCSNDASNDKPKAARAPGDAPPASDELPIQETLSWYLGDAEFNSILGNWQSFDNFRRVQYLRGFFRRYFEEDDEQPEDPSRARPVGWSFETPPHREDRNAPSFRGQGYSVGDPSRGDEPFRWAFEQVPAGTYQLSVNLPAKEELPVETDPKGERKRLGPEGFAGTARYAIRVRRPGMPEAKTVVDLPMRCKLGTLPDEFPRADRPWQTLDSPRRGALGLWYRLETLTIPDGPGPVDVEVELSHGSGDGKLIADAVRLDRSERDAAPDPPAIPTGSKP